MSDRAPHFRLGPWVLAFAAGIYLANRLNWYVSPWILLVPVLLSAVGLVRLQLRWSWIWTALYAGLIFTFGLYIFDNQRTPPWKGPGSDTLLVRLQTGWDSGWVFSSSALVLSSENMGCSVQLEWSAGQPPGLPGDVLAVTGRSSLFYNPIYPHAFQAGEYYEHQRMSARVRATEIHIVETGSGLQRTMSIYRNRIRQAIQNWPLSDRGRAFYGALLAGDRSHLDPDDRDAFADAGLVHLLAVSGLHVGIIEGLLGLLLVPRWFEQRRLTRTLRLMLILLGLWCFVLMTGAGPSVVRAGVMFTLIRWARWAGRPGQASEAVWLSAFLALMVNPHLLWNLGFQLSYLAVFGIVYGHAAWDSGFIRKLNSWPRRIATALSVSFWAQLTTAPLTVYTFHRFPTYFLLSNLLLLPLVPLYLIAGIVLAVLWLAGVQSGWPWRAMDLAVEGYYEAVRYLAGLPGAAIENWYLPFFSALCAFLAVVALMWSSWHRQWKGYWLTLIFILPAFGGWPTEPMPYTWFHRYRGMSILEHREKHIAHIWLSDDDWRRDLFLRDSQPWRQSAGIDSVVVTIAEIPEFTRSATTDTLFPVNYLSDVDSTPLPYTGTPSDDRPGRGSSSGTSSRDPADHPPW